MSKWVEVKAEIVKHFLVEIEDHETDEDAEQYVSDELMMEFESLESEEVPADRVDDHKRHTDKDKILALRELEASA